MTVTSNNTMNPQHIEALLLLMVRAMETDATKALAFIQTCWGKNMQRKSYERLIKLEAGLVFAAIKDHGIGLALDDWQDSVLPALALLNANTRICKGCGELGILRGVSGGWQAIDEEMECPFCHKDNMMRPEMEKAPTNWITGQPLEPNVAEIGIDRVLIPVTKDGVIVYIQRNYGASHQIDSQFASYDVLHVLNVLLNYGFDGIDTPRQALKALLRPTECDLMAQDIRVIIDRVQREEWLVGKYSDRSVGPSLDSVASANVGGQLSQRGFDKLVGAALKQFPMNPALLGWINSPERGPAISDRPVIPRKLIEVLADIFTREAAAHKVCTDAGIPRSRLHSMDVPSHFWQHVAHQVQGGLI